MIIVNKATGERVRNIRSRRAIWADGAVTEAVRPGFERGDEVVCETQQTFVGEGPAHRIASEEFDGDRAWVVTRERYTPESVPPDTNTLLRRVRDEAERRIQEGTRVNGVRFRCDTRSMTRVHSLLTLAQRAEADAKKVDIKFQTEAGDTIEITSVAQAEILFNAASDFVAAILGRSSQLQNGIQDMADHDRCKFDETLDSHWPSRVYG